MSFCSCALLRDSINCFKFDKSSSRLLLFLCSAPNFVKISCFSSFTFMSYSESNLVESQSCWISLYQFSTSWLYNSLCLESSFSYFKTFSSDCSTYFQTFFCSLFISSSLFYKSEFCSLKVSFSNLTFAY